MGFWEMVVIGAMGTFLGKGLSNARRAAEEEKRRKNTPCNFTDGISEEQFEMIVKRSGRHIKRLMDLSINGPVVYGTVRTNSGLSEWDFKLDFNDYGHITGRYWLIYGNEDSSIPIKIAENISSMIDSFPKGFDKAKSASTFEEHDNTNKYENPEYDTDAWKDINLENIMQQAELFQDRKRKRRKKKIKKFFWLLLWCLLLNIAIFVFYKYREKQKYIEVGISSLEARGQDYNQIIKKLERIGFTNISANPEYDLEIADIENENKISWIEIHGDNVFDDSSQYPYDALVKIKFHALKYIDVPISAKATKKMSYMELETILRNAGFVNISTQAKCDLITGWVNKDGSVDEVSINGENKFSESSSYRQDAEIIIIYHSFKKAND